MRRLACAWALLACTASGCAPPPPTQDRPDVLLITVDTLRADRLGSYGFELDTSPHVDALASRGVVFERAIAASSVTAPAHASIMTSRFTRGHTVGWSNGLSMLASGPTLAELFRAAGYETAAFVGNRLLTRRLGFDRGFDSYDDELPAVEVNRQSSFERDAAGTTQRALAWLSARTGDRPFLLWVHYQDPHGPYTPPEGFAGRFRVEPAADEQPLPVLASDYALSGIPAYQALEGRFLPSEYEGLYADEIFYADHWIGRLLEAVDGVSSRETAVLFTADHGEALGETYRYFSHGNTTTPEVAHVPLILRAPGLEPARRRELVHHVDVLPTLLDLAGLPVPEGVRGLALGAYLREGRALPDRLLYCDIGVEISAYRSSGGDGAETSFVRVRGASGAWRAALRDEPFDPSLTWEMYRWGPEGWERARLDRSLREPVRDYASRALPMVPAPPAPAGERERLEALGYVLPGAEAVEGAD